MNIENQITTLVENIKEDYLRWTSRNYTKELSEINETMIADFNEKISWNEGSKYIKIITNGSVWGFVVAVNNDKKFKYGDILKAAGYNAPARNAARGNVFEDYDIQWTGPNYLR